MILALPAGVVQPENVSSVDLPEPDGPMIDTVVLIADGDAKLACLETKTGAEFEEEPLDVIEQRGLEIVFRIGGTDRRGGGIR